jgi:hypothetical protein
VLSDRPDLLSSACPSGGTGGRTRLSRRMHLAPEVPGDHSR